MANQVSLKILITATNEVAAVLSAIRADLNSTREALAGLSSASPENLRKNLEALGAMATSAEKGLSSFGNASKALDTGSAAGLANLADSIGSVGRGSASATSNVEGLARASNELGKTGSGSGQKKPLEETAAAAKAAADKVEALGEAARKADASASNTPGGGLRGWLRDLVGGAKSAEGALGGVVGAGLSLKGGFDGLLGSVKFLAGGFLALKGVGLLKDVLDTAARTETLGVVLNTVGRNAGYTGAELAKVDKDVQKLGITAASSRESLTSLIQSEIPVSFGAPLARAAQDLAVISGQSSSDTFKNLITNIQQLDTVGLRFMGIMINKEQVIAKAASETGKSINATAEKQIFANAVLAEAAKLSGIYESSLSSAGKQLTSMPRYVEALKVSLGSSLLPTYLETIKGSIGVLKALDGLAIAFGGGAKESKLFGTELIAANEPLGALSGTVKFLADGLKGAIGLVAEFATEIKAIAIGLLAVGAINVVIGAIGLLAAGFTNIVLIGAAVIEYFALFGAVAAGSVAGASLAFGPILLAVAALTAALGAAYFIYQKFFSGDEAIKSAEGLEAATAKYVTQLQRETALQGENLKIQEKLFKARNQLTVASISEAPAIEDRIKAIGLEVEANKTAREGARKDAEKSKLLLDDNYDRLNKSQLSRIELAGKVAGATQKAIVEEIAYAGKLDEALRKINSNYGKLAEGVSSTFAQESSGVVTAIEALGRAGIKTSTALDELQVIISALGQKVSTEAEFEKFVKTLELAAVRAKQAGQDISETLANNRTLAEGRIGESRLEGKFGGKPELARARTDLGQQNTNRLAALKVAAEAEQAASERSLAVDKFRYDQGLLLLGTFTEKKASALRAQARAEIDLAEATLRGQQNQLAITAPETPESRKVLADITATKAQLLTISGKYEGLEQVQVRETYEIRKKLILDIRQLRNELNTARGNGEAAAVDAVSIKYEEQARVLGPLLDANVKLGLAEKRRMDETEARQQARMERLQKEIELNNALIDLASAKVSRQQGAGDITDLDAQAQSNALIRARIANVERLIEVQRRSNIEIAATGDLLKAQAGETLITQYQTQLENLTASLDTLGKKLRETFTSSLADGLQTLIKGPDGSALAGIASKKSEIATEERKAALSAPKVRQQQAGDELKEVQAIYRAKDSLDATNYRQSSLRIEQLQRELKGLKPDPLKTFFTGIAETLNKQILGVITKDLAQQLTKGLDGLGGGLFGKLGELITGKRAEGPAIPGTSALPMVVADSPGVIALNDALRLNAQAQTPLASGLGDLKTRADTIAQNTANTVAAIESLAKAIPGVPAKGEVFLGKDGGILQDGAGGSRNMGFDFATASKAIGGKGGALPVPAFNEEFDKAASASGLDKYNLNGDFLRYVALKESSMKPLADSGKAKGLMQFTPATFKGLGYNEKDIFDPKTSIEASAKLFRQLLDQFNGDLDKALAAYNAGPVVAKARAKGDFTQQSDANRKETDNYVKVLGTEGVGGKPLKVEVVPSGATAKTSSAASPTASTAGALPSESTLVYDEMGNVISGSLGTNPRQSAPPQKGATGSFAEQAPQKGATGSWEEALTTTAKSTGALGEKTKASLPVVEKATQSTDKLATSFEALQPLVQTAVEGSKVTPVDLTSPQAVQAVQAPQATNPLTTPAVAPLGSSGTPGAPVTVELGVKGTASDPLHVIVDNQPAVAQAGNQTVTPSSGAVQLTANGPVSERDRILASFDENPKTSASVSGPTASSPSERDRILNRIVAPANGKDDPTRFFQGLAPGIGAAVGAKVGGPLGGTIGALIGQGIASISPKTIDGFFSNFKSSVTSGFDALSSAASGGGLGLSDLFSSLGDSLSSLFKSLSGAAGGGGGGGGGIFGSIASLFGSGGGSPGPEAARIFSLFAATGGHVQGAGTGTSDSIPAWLSHGEYVINAKSTAEYLPLLHAINEGMDVDSTALRIPKVNRFATGGLVDEMSQSRPEARSFGKSFPTNPSNVGQRVTVVQNISTPNPESFRRSQDQMAVDAQRALQRATRRNG